MHPSFHGSNQKVHGKHETRRLETFGGLGRVAIPNKMLHNQKKSQLRVTAGIMPRLLVYRTTSKILLRLPWSVVAVAASFQLPCLCKHGGCDHGNYYRNDRSGFQRWVEIALLVGLGCQNVHHLHHISSDFCSHLAFSSHFCSMPWFLTTVAVHLLGCDLLLIVAVLQAFHGLTQYRFCFQKVDVLPKKPMEMGLRNGHFSVLFFGLIFHQMEREGG